jgi:hypothetical protein
MFGNCYTGKYWNTIHSCSKTTWMEMKALIFSILGTKFFLPPAHLSLFWVAAIAFPFPFYVLSIYNLKCSAIGHFRKQFAYLEENSGRSAPVIPLERKHVSLPRYDLQLLVPLSSKSLMIKWFIGLICFEGYRVLFNLEFLCSSTVNMLSAFFPFNLSFCSQVYCSLKHNAS